MASSQVARVCMATRLNARYLTRAEYDQIERLTRRLGDDHRAAARALGVSLPTLDRARYGGRVWIRSILKIRLRLERLCGPIAHVAPEVH